MTIPFDRDFEENTQVTHDILEESLNILSAPHVLLIEDNEIAQHSQIDKLQRAGCHVVLAKNGAEAEAYFNLLNVDFIIVDLGLPDTDGLTLIEQFRCRVDHVNHVVPMIILTAHAVPDDFNKDAVSKVTELLIKPLMLADAKRLVREYSLPGRLIVG